MCGIVAILSRDGPICPEALERATKRLHHRGPDGRRQWIAPHQQVGLGHARLSIIDLVTGDQPIANEDESLHIVVNGEFYDFERIQRDLIAGGHKLRTRSDSEIALHLYEDVGTRCLEHLRGEFAFVIWDEPNGTLFAARDRFGIKPLYYALHDNKLFLASEAKALFEAGVPARWDHEAFYQLTYVHFDQDRSLFEGVYQVPPGCYLLATRGHTQIVPYWDIDYRVASESAHPRTEEECIEAFHDALDEAVQLRLRADVPVGCYLSGGIDSCALLGLAALHRSDKIEAFTLCFDTELYNEEAVAREMAEHAGANFRPLPVTQTDLADHFADAVWHSETITANPHGAAKFLLSEKVRDEGFKVVLTGEGSDELLGGYVHSMRDVLLYNNEGLDQATKDRMMAQLESANELSRGNLLPTGQALPLESVKRTLGFVPTWLETRSANSARYSRLFRRSFADEFDGRDAFKVFLNRFDINRSLVGRDPLNQSLYLWQRSMLCNYLLNVLGDRMEMGHSIEGRVPFLDHRVAELLATMPIDMKVHGTSEKYVLREATRPVLTDTVYARKKHPFLAPPSGLNLEGELTTMMQDVLRGPVLKSQPFYDPVLVIGLLDRLPELEERKRSGISYILTSVLSACVLHERYHLG